MIEHVDRDLTMAGLVELFYADLTAAVELTGGVEDAEPRNCCSCRSAAPARSA